MKKKTRKKAETRKARRLPAAIIAFVALTFGGLLLHSGGSSRSGGTDRALVSHEAPDFTLAALDGRNVALSEFRGKVVILDFWATWCPPCKREIPDFIDIQKTYAARGVQVIGVGLDQASSIREFALANGINYPVLLGTDDVSDLYGGITGIPTTFVIDRKGTIAQKFEGYRDRETFVRAIESLL